MKKYEFWKATVTGAAHSSDPVKAIERMMRSMGVEPLPYAERAKAMRRHGYLPSAKHGPGRRFGAPIYDLVLVEKTARPDWYGKIKTKKFKYKKKLRGWFFYVATRRKGTGLVRASDRQIHQRPE